MSKWPNLLSLDCQSYGSNSARGNTEEEAKEKAESLWAKQRAQKVTPQTFCWLKWREEKKEEGKEGRGINPNTGGGLPDGDKTQTRRLGTVLLGMLMKSSGSDIINIHMYVMSICR